jgi:hypothetical protein
VPVRKRTGRAAGFISCRFQESADFRDFSRLARLMLIERHRGNLFSGRREMAKLEAVAFAVGFCMTGLITFVALPLA